MATHGVSSLSTNDPSSFLLHSRFPPSADHPTTHNLKIPTRTHPNRRGNVAAISSPSKRSSIYGGRIPSILHALESISDLDRALRPWSENLTNKERTIILKEQASSSRALQIFEWFKKTGSVELNVIHYNVVLHSLGRSRMWAPLLSLWLEMQDKSIAPNNCTYGTLVDVFAKAGLTSQALVWLSDMLKRGVHPDEVTAGTVLHTYKKACAFSDAHRFFTKWSTSSSSSPPASCNSNIFNILIDTYGKAGKVEEASAAFAEMLHLGIPPNTITFNTMIHIYGNHGRLDEVTSLISKMEELGCLPNVRTYDILVSLYAKNDDIDKATFYFLEMKKANLLPDVVGYRTLLYAYAIRCMVKEAESIAFEMEENGLEIDEYSQSAMLRMYVHVGRMERSWFWFNKFERKMGLECYAANIDAFAEKGYAFYAERAFSRCVSSGKLSVLVFNVMIKAYGIEKNYDKVCDTFDAMESYGVSPDKCSFVSIVKILSEANLPWKGLRYVRKMRSAGLVDDCFPYCAVISSFARLGELETVEDLFREMVGFGVKPDIVMFGVMVDAFAEAGNVREAEKYVDLMEDAGYPANSIIYNTLIKLYTNVRYLQEASTVYRKARLLDDGPNLYSSNCMIELYADNNMVKEAEKIFSDLRQRGEANEFSYAMMVCLYKKVGLLKDGLSIAEEMLQRRLLSDVLSYNAVIELLTLNDRLKDAVKIFQQMLNSGPMPNDATFRSLGTNLIRRGVPKTAVNYLEKSRKKNRKNGLLAWTETLQSMLGFDDQVSELGTKLESLPQT